MLSKTSCCVRYYSSARNPINHAQDYLVHGVGGRGVVVMVVVGGTSCLLFRICFLLQSTLNSWLRANQDRWIVVVQAESSTRVEQSLLCNFFFSARIGQAIGCWWAQHNNLTSIICLLESVVGVCRTLIHACLYKSNQPGQPVSVIRQTGFSMWMKWTHSRVYSTVAGKMQYKITFMKQTVLDFTKLNDKNKNLHLKKKSQSGKFTSSKTN